MLPFRSGRSRHGSTLFAVILIAVAGLVVNAGKAKDTKKPKAKSAEKNVSDSSASVPIPIGHEAKGVTLPDYDLEGRIRGRFLAGVARRLDEHHLQMRDLKMHTFTAEEKPDLEIDMTTSVLDLRTRVLSSHERTTVKRTDFELTGNSMEFNTSTHEGTLVGDVKMRVFGRSHFGQPDGE
jgi:hypothetical protein